MKPFFRLSFHLLFTVAFAGRSFAQTSDSATSPQKESELALPPLITLIDSAIKHNAMVQFRRQEIDAKECNLTAYKNYWTRNLGVQVDTRYGTFDNYSNIASGQSTTIATSTNRQFNYGAGFFLKFPVIDIVDRKNQLRKAKAELAQAGNMAAAQEDEVRQLVIRQYQELLLKQRLLHIRSAAIGSARVSKEMIETQFRNGSIPLVEYVRVSDIVDRIEADYETIKTDFTTAKMILEDLVGFTFTTVAKNKHENN